MTEQNIIEIIIDEYHKTAPYKRVVQKADLAINLLAYIISRLPADEKTKAESELEKIKAM